MLDIEFLNEKATKINGTIKKISQIIDFGEETFLKTPMYPDRVKYYLIILYDELEAISCHIFSNYTGEKVKENCLKKIVEESIFSEKLNRVFTDFINFRENLFKEDFSYKEELLYHFTKEISSTLKEYFLKELATVVKQLKEKQPKLAIPVNLVKVNHYASAIKSETKRLKTFSNMDFDSFKNSDFAIDRSRYFMVVAIDSALWICRHIVRQLKLKPSKNCFSVLSENNCLEKDLAQKLEEITKLRDRLANPKEDIDTNLLYNLVKGEFEALMNSYIKAISKMLKYGCG